MTDRRLPIDMEPRLWTGRRDRRGVCAQWPNARLQHRRMSSRSEVQDQRARPCSFHVNHRRGTLPPAYPVDRIYRPTPTVCAAPIGATQPSVTFRARQCVRLIQAHKVPEIKLDLSKQTECNACRGTFVVLRWATVQHVQPVLQRSATRRRLPICSAVVSAMKSCCGADTLLPLRVPCRVFVCVGAGCSLQRIIRSQQ